MCATTASPSEVAPQNAPANRWLPARTIGGIKDVPNWSNVVPRLGVTFDPTNKGKTVLKASLSKYVVNQGCGHRRHRQPAVREPEPLRLG